MLDYDESMASNTDAAQVDGVAGPFEFITYEETAELVAAIGSAMAAVGVTAHQKCSIYGGNCIEWMVAMQVPSSPAETSAH